MRFSVLMSVYYKEVPENLREALMSIFVNQTLKPDELVLVLDGPVGESLMKVINDFTCKFRERMKIIELDENVGLGKALAIGLEECSYNIVARMDSDDISHKRRFEKQIEYFKEDAELDLLGGYISEFYNNTEDIVSIRKVPLEYKKIRKRLKKRNPINHVTVMFKKSSVLKVGNYQHILFLEDYHLWVRMIYHNLNIKNISDILVLVRTGNNMFARRTDKQYITSWNMLQKMMLRLKIINYIEYVINMINIFIFVNIPPVLKEKIYRYILRETDI